MIAYQLNNSKFYFEVLPVHPKPERFESLTSYVARLGVMNGFETKASMIALLFPGNKIGIVDQIIKCLPCNLGELPNITNCSETTLKTTTFYHLVKKFGRGETAVASTIFLAGSVTDYLRFCPICIDQYSYYQLSWRIKMPSVCLEHSCWLLDRCSYCEHQIPLLTNPFTFGKCLNCQKELKSCKSVRRFERKDSEKTQHLIRDLEFLLIPHSYESISGNVMAYLGEQLRIRRHARQETIKQVASRLGLPSSEIFFVEDGRSQNGTASFQTYLAYTYYSSLTFVDLFNMFVTNSIG